ncbi:MAG TPA: glycosyltransferase [Methanocella sp.]|uniref:glycosyltransferase n=1 Tax=Methanocella sp. TaxID=2052833 RepID=UPI002C89734C|nr:glycosyltransferase [Methanocella sp.]HTY91607.1 glycosyltransferase [Methanocella sp.]
MQPLERPPVSVYVPCYNAERYIEKCIQAILAQTYKADEIIIVDDGCTDGTVDIASKYPVKIVHHGKNKGLAAGRNTGFRSARNEFVAGLDADCIPQPDWLEKIMGRFTDERVAGVGGKLLEKNRDTMPDRWRSSHMVQNWGDKEAFNPNFLFGADNVYRKSCIEKAGFFNEKYRTNYEDVDIGEKLKAKGYTLIYTPDAVVWHLRTDNTRSLLRACWNWNYSNWPLTTKNVLYIFSTSPLKAVRMAAVDLALERDVRFALFDIRQGLYCMWRVLKAVSER